MVLSVYFVWRGRGVVSVIAGVGFVGFSGLWF